MAPAFNYDSELLGRPRHHSNTPSGSVCRFFPVGGKMEKNCPGKIGFGQIFYASAEKIPWLTALYCATGDVATWLCQPKRQICSLYLRVPSIKVEGKPENSIKLKKKKKRWPKLISFQPCGMLLLCASIWYIVCMYNILGVPEASCRH